MIAGISTLCFGASYAVALALDLSRLAVRSPLRTALVLGFAIAGLLAHTLYLGYRATTATGAPLSSEFDWYLVAAWILAAAYLYSTLMYPRSAFGFFVLPLVLLLVLVADLIARDEPFPQDRASQVWGAIHGVFVLAGTLAVMVGFVAGLMYLLQSYRLKHKRPPLVRIQLPNLERLQHTNARAMIASVFALGAGFLSGAVLNLVNHRRDLDELPWNDPVVWSSALLLVWLVAATVFSTLYKPAQQGRKVAYLTVASFLFLVLSLAIRILLPTAHSAPRWQDEPAAAARPLATTLADLPSPPLRSARGGDA